MGKYKIGLTLSIGDYRTMHIEVSEKDSFEECEAELREFLRKKQHIIALNKEELKESISME